MILTSGQPILSEFRSACPFGLIAVGCTDHPGVWSRMAAGQPRGPGPRDAHARGRHLAARDTPFITAAAAAA